MNKILFGSIIGLIKTIETLNEIDENTINLFLNSLKNIDSKDDYYINLIKEEKKRLAPDCASCLNPCGRTDDFDFNELNNDQNLNLKREIINHLSKKANNNLNIEEILALMHNLYLLTYENNKDALLDILDN